MKKDVWLNIIISIIIAIDAPVISSKLLPIDPIILIFITAFVIIFIWFLSFIQEIDTRNNLDHKRITDIEQKIEVLKEDLNTERRLTILEEWKKNMRQKRAQINVIDLMKILLIILAGYLLLKALGMV